jgi:hypothetical protein
MFYLAQILNALYIVAVACMVVGAGIFGGTFISELLDDDDNCGFKKRGIYKKEKKISAIVTAIAILWMVFVPSGDTYLKMKFGEDRMEVLMNVLDEKVLSTIETTELIDYD